MTWSFRKTGVNSNASPFWLVPLFSLFFHPLFSILLFILFFFLFVLFYLHRAAGWRAPNANIKEEYNYARSVVSALANCVP